MNPPSLKTSGLPLAALVLAAAGALPAWGQDAFGLPRSLSQEPNPEPKQDPKEEPARPAPTTPQEEAAGSPFLDFSHFELEPHVGILAFNGAYESTARFGGGILARAPMPWFSKDFLGLGKVDFGAFIDITISSIDRNIDLLDTPSGTLMFVAAGLDYDAINQDGFQLQLQLGLQYGYFGGVTDLHNGVAPLVGLASRVPVGGGIVLTFNPQIGFGNSGDWIIFVNFGILIDF